jgi:threonine synthase
LVGGIGWGDLLAGFVGFQQIYADELGRSARNSGDALAKGGNASYSRTKSTIDIIGNNHYI